MRAEPGAQQGPEAFHGVDVDLAGPVPVLVAGIFAAGMADRLVPVALGRCQRRLKFGSAALSVLLRGGIGI